MSDEDDIPDEVDFQTRVSGSPRSGRPPAPTTTTTTTASLTESAPPTSLTSPPSDTTGSHDGYTPDSRSKPRRVDLSAAHSEGAPNEERYALGKEIGKGGMGEVWLARDERVGRWVALKVMLDEAKSEPAARRRFLTEARVQGQLEHPAVVPVYDLGRDEAGRIFFTMKRIGGVGLDQVVRGLRKGDAALQSQFTVRRLLSIFQQVCLAVDYAHTKGVIHRDLKPSNLMVGDFGEVYVLDWGVAKILSEADEVPSTERRRAARDAEELTQQDHVLGTVGYMAPEQLESSSTVDARADIYSLGAVLFYLLALEPLHGRGSPLDRAQSTRLGADARPSVRAPERDLPPELDAICVKATAFDPKERYRSARELHDAIERYLEGDRDTRLRAELATRHMARANESADRAAEGGPDASEHRRAALRRAGRALALDPENVEATDLLARFMFEPPKELPPEVEQEIQELSQGEAVRTARLGAVTLLTFLAVAGQMLWVGIHSWSNILWIIAPLAGAAVVGTFVAWTRPIRIHEHTALLGFFVCCTIGATTSIAGPLWLTPQFAIIYVAIVVATHGLGRTRILLVAMALLAVLVPVALEWSGAIPAQYHFRDGGLFITPGAVDLNPVRVRIAMIVLSIASIVLLSVVLWRFSEEDMRNREKLQLLVWHLRQLSPQRTAPGSDPPPPAPPGSGGDSFAPPPSGERTRLDPGPDL